jgi:hypothetical protein
MKLLVFRVSAGTISGQKTHTAASNPAVNDKFWRKRPIEGS